MNREGLSAPILVLVTLILLLSIGILVQVVFLSGSSSAQSGLEDTTAEAGQGTEDAKDGIMSFLHARIEEGIDLQLNFGTGDDGGSSNGGSGFNDDGSDSSGWSQGADMPVAVTGNAGTVINGELYSFGGERDNQQYDTPDIRSTFAYDPSADSWSEQENLPRRMHAASAAAVGEQAYVFAGADPGAPWDGCCLRNDIWRYEPGTGFTQVGSHPGGSYGAAAVYDDHTGLIYVAGGATGEQSNARRIFTFNPQTEQVENPNWATLPSGVRWPAAAIVEADGNRYLHVMGGVTYPSGQAAAAQFNARYNLENGNRQSMAQLPEPASKLPRSNPVIDNTIYVPLGLSWPQGRQPREEDFKEETWAYDPESDSWDTNLPSISSDRARDVGATGVIDGTLYIAGGHQKRYGGDGTHNTFSALDAFTP